MMFVNDAPPSSVLAETHGKPKFELKLLAAAEIATATNGRRKRHIVAGSYGYVVKIEFDRLGLPRQRTSATSPYRRPTLATRMAAAHRTSLYRGHGLRELHQSFRRAPPSTIGR
jgi:hypothetical protein